MRHSHIVAGLTALLTTVGAGRPAAAQSIPPSIDLIVDAGRPLRVALDERVRLRQAGQVVTGTVTEPVYAYDRIVIPVGTRVRGHVLAIESGSRFVRARAYLGGNFSPPKHAVLQFDTLILDEGREEPIDTIVKGGVPSVARRVAGGSTASGHAASDDDASPTLATRARGEIRQRTVDAVSGAKQQVRDAVATVKSLRQADQWARIKDAAVQQLPYHPQYLAKGTVYDAELVADLIRPRGSSRRGACRHGARPDSILTARLATTLDSSKTPRGTPFEAVITETVFSADHQVVLPEGTKLTGTVTFAAPARRFHRNGRLRFLFERVQVPNQPSAPLLGALHAIDASGDDRVAVDDEGGATLENSKTRFIAPALSLLSLHASLEGDGHSFADPDGDGTIKNAGSGAGSRGVGGFIGMGLIGAAVSQITRPVGIAMGALRRGSHDLAKRARQGTRGDLPRGYADPGPARAGSRSPVRLAALGRSLPLLGLLAQQPAFRAETRLVVIHATVRNPRGELVTNLAREAFTVTENGKRQPITLFRRDDIPVSLGLLIDNSGSMRTLRSKVEAAALALARASNPQDEIFVLNFNDKARIDVPFTSDVRVLEAGIARVDSIGGTAAWDAIDQARPSC